MQKCDDVHNESVWCTSINSACNAFAQFEHQRSQLAQPIELKCIESMLVT